MSNAGRHPLVEGMPARTIAEAYSVQTRQISRYGIKKFLNLPEDSRQLMASLMRNLALKRPYRAGCKPQR